MELQDDLNSLAPGRKVVLHYTPPQYTPPDAVLADGDQFYLKDAPQDLVKEALSSHEKETKDQHTGLSHDASGSLIQKAESRAGGTPQICSADLPPTVAINEALQAGVSQESNGATDRRISVSKMQLNQCGLRRPCNSALASLPKYTATVIDAFPEEDRAFKHVSTVFIVPQVRRTFQEPLCFDPLPYHIVPSFCQNANCFGRLLIC